MKFQVSIVSVLFVFLLGSSVVWGQTHRSRTWKDKSGSYSIDATFVEESGKMVKLKTPDGEVMEIAFDQLSDSDQYYVKELRTDAANPFKKASPFQKAGSGGASSSSMKSETADDSGPLKGRLVSEDLDDARDMLSKPMVANEWDFPQITPIASQGKKTQTTIRLPEATDIFERFAGMANNHSNQHAILGYTLDRPGRDNETSTRLVLCDLVKGKFAGAATIKGIWAPVSLKDDGRTALLMSNESGSGGKEKLQLVQLMKSGVESVVKWTPYDSVSSRFDRDVRFAKFVGDDKIVTASKRGDVVIWSYPDVKPLARVESEHSIMPSLTSDGRYLLFSRDKRIGMIDLVEERIVANHDLPFSWINKVTLNPSGTTMAVIEGNKMTTFDPVTLTEKDEFYFSNAVFSDEVDWVNDRYVVLGKRLLFDTEKGMEVWTFDKSDAMFAGDGVIYSTAKSGTKIEGVVSFPVPNVEMTEAIQAAESSRDYFLMRKGSDVSIDVSGIQDGSQQQNVRATMEKRLKEAGFTVSLSSETKIVLATSQGQPKEVSYRMMGRGGPGENTGTFTPFNSSMKIQYNGEDIYTRNSSSGIPFMITLKEGESIQDVANRYSKPSYTYFDSVEIPHDLPRPREDGKRGFGTTEFTLR